MATVPNVVGDEEGEALRKLTEQRLRMGNVRRALEGAGRPGTVMEQNPRPDVMVARETPVDLVIKEDGVRVPSVQNRIVDDVATVLLASRPKYTLAYQIDPNRPLGTILSLSPDGGQFVPRNSVVTLTLSRPRGRLNDWTVADVQKFKALEQLERKIQMRNLGPGRINQPIK
jgi:beta-lactam-binding protein with PASTA domain